MDELAPDTPSVSGTTLAIIFTICGCFFNALSLILMKFSIEKVASDARSKGSAKASIYNKWWFFGFFCIILGTLFNIVSIRFGNILLLASSSALTLIFNTILSVLILKEKYFKSDIVGIVLCSLGSITSMIFSKNSDKEFTSKEIYDLFSSYASMVYFVLSAIGVFFVWWNNNSVRNKVAGCWL